MRKVYFWAVMAAATLGIFRVAPAQVLVNTPERLISVTGEAEVKVVPDEVTFSLGLTTSDSDIAVAKKLNNERVKNVLALAKELGIDAKDVQTDYIQINPNYDNNQTRFRVSRSVTIILRDMRKYDDTLTRMVQNNRANALHGINFRTTQLRKYRDQARALATQAAREKANALAESLGVKAGAPYSIREESNSWGYWGGRSMANMQVSSSASWDEVSPSTTLSPGQISVSARVAVSFELVKP